MESLLKLFNRLSASYHQFARHKDQNADLGTKHLVDQPRKNLRLVRAVRDVVQGKGLEFDRKAHVDCSQHVLDAELSEFHLLKANLADDPSKLFGSKLARSWRLCTSYYHLAGRKCQSCGFRIANSQDHSTKTARVVLGVACFEVNCLEIQRRAQVYCAGNVLQDDATSCRAWRRARIKAWSCAWSCAWNASDALNALNAC